MNSDYRVGDLVAEFLALCQVKTAFGVVSIHNIPLLDAIGRRNQIRFVMSRGEMGGGHMADGYARVAGSLGVLISSTGPGAANAVPALLEAQFAGTPLLHLTGNTATKFADRQAGHVHDTRDQLGMLRSVSKAAYRIRTPQEAIGALTRAAMDALTPPTGPVSVEIPIDVQRSTVSRPEVLNSFHLPLPAPKVPSDLEMRELVARVSAAKRPLLWLGAGARDAGAPVRKLIDLGFAVVTSWAGRGVVPEDDPMTLGAMTGLGMESIEDFYRTVDLLLVVGSRLRGHETGDFSLPLPKNLIQIDVDPAANGRTYASEFFVCGDGRITLEALARDISGRIEIDPNYPKEFGALKERARKEYRDSLGPYATFAAQIRKVMPRDAIWVRDITISQTTWGNRLFEIYGPRDSVYPVGAGIGEGLSLALGAALAAGNRKTVVMTGDGGLCFNLSELWTAVQERLDVVVIVMNDNGYGVIRHIQDATAEGRHYFSDLQCPDLRELAALARIPYARVGREGEFGAAVARALDLSGPSIVEVDMKAVGEVPKYYPYGPKIPQLSCVGNVIRAAGSSRRFS